MIVQIYSLTHAKDVQALVELGGQTLAQPAQEFVLHGPSPSLPAQTTLASRPRAPLESRDCSRVTTIVPLREQRGRGEKRSRCDRSAGTRA